NDELAHQIRSRGWRNLEPLTLRRSGVPRGCTRLWPTHGEHQSFSPVRPKYARDAIGFASRSAIHAEISDKRHARRHAVIWIGAGNRPSRTMRQIVVRDRRTVATTSDVHTSCMVAGGTNGGRLCFTIA